jgi:hypothetical protein
MPRALCWTVQHIGGAGSAGQNGGQPIHVWQIWNCFIITLYVLLSSNIIDLVVHTEYQRNRTETIGGFYMQVHLRSSGPWEP